MYLQNVLINEVTALYSLWLYAYYITTGITVAVFIWTLETAMTKILEKGIIIFKYMGPVYVQNFSPSPQGCRANQKKKDLRK